MECGRLISAFEADCQPLPEDLYRAFSHQDSGHLLSVLSTYALKPQWTERIFLHFAPLALELAARWTVKDFGASACAFGRVLPLLPHLTSLAEALFASSGYEQGLLQGLFDEATQVHIFGSQEDTQGAKDLLVAAFRLLQINNDAFAKYIRPAKLQLLLRHEDRSICYLAIRLLCLYMHASDSILNDMIRKYLGDAPIQGRWEETSIDFAFLTLWETQRLERLEHKMIEIQRLQMFEPHVSSHSLIQDGALSSNVVNVSGVLLLRSAAVKSAVKNESSLVPTKTTESNLHNVADALTRRNAILITGLMGSGKTAAVRDLAKRVDCLNSMVTLHLNEQSDAKLLVGLYTTGSEPGTFQWQPGVLTTAVKEGRWVFLEDLDRASNEVMATLLPLIEKRELLIPSRGEKIRAHTDFKIFATMRSHLNMKQKEITFSSRILGNRLWHQVHFETLRAEEVTSIIQDQYPCLRHFISHIIMVYDGLRSKLRDDEAFGSVSPLTMKPITTRELFKWCARMEATFRALEPEFWSGMAPERIPEETMSSMFLDAVDCFVGNFEDGRRREILISSIAESLHIDPERMRFLLRQRSIHIKVSQRQNGSSLRLGRATLSGFEIVDHGPASLRTSGTAPFSITPQNLRLLEQVACAVQYQEPLLLVGETGIGKTAVVQHLTRLSGKKLLAINLSQQSESSDLLGGFKPLNTRSLIMTLKEEFDDLFEASFSQKKNQHFLEMLGKSIAKAQFKRVVTLWRQAIKMARKATESAQEVGSSASKSEGEQRQKRRKLGALRTSYEAKWEAFAAKIDSLDRQLSRSTGALSFVFAEGKLVKSVRNGNWVLLDEINLTTPDTLETISELLESGSNSPPSLLLTEAGNVERVVAHPDFRLFAAMNPATDVGKKDLPTGIRSRFTEIFVNPPDKDIQSLRCIVGTFLEQSLQSTADKKMVATVTDAYLEMQRLVQETGLVDGSGERPHYTLRTLTRALSHATKIVAQCNLRRALYEGLCMCFLTCLGVESELRLQQVLRDKIFSNTAQANAEIKKPLREPQDNAKYIHVDLHVHQVENSKATLVENHWLPQGCETIENPDYYIITPYICRNLRNLTRAISGRKHPVLIQGPTSAGKTSMIEYLAKRSGNKFVRINNHEHTDLQEYLGAYASTNTGELVYQEGVLVQALREGHWVVLDELNLAPTDVLEALNRLLDDNRELLVPETQEIIRPHPDFMLFATQNPVGPYGGRKMLSRAFRNRFLELHFDDIPVVELNVILARRSNLPESWCKLIVEVYERLSALRQEQRIFEQNSFATLRDLFRWAFRGADDVESLAMTGYMLLAEKVRKTDERQAVKEVIETVMSRKGVKVRIDQDGLYKKRIETKLSELARSPNDQIVWTKSMRRLFVLVSEAISNNEPVLLVGDTGCGKTTVCQMISHAMNKPLNIVNAHQNTETGDLIGAQRPVRNRAAAEQQLFTDLKQILTTLNVEQGINENSHYQLDDLFQSYENIPADILKLVPLELSQRISLNRAKQKSLFEWCDGSLVQAMRQGQHYLLDEISLAEDSVLERMNSVLDPQRSILLAEKGVDNTYVEASDGFQFLATMNPGGDFGKKELSPALRNRFTEIWVPSLSDVEDIQRIVLEKLRPDAKHWAATVVEFAQWFTFRYASLKTQTVSIRDILAWIQFVNAQAEATPSTILHGACMVYIDSLGANPSALLAMTGKKVNDERELCFKELSNLLGRDLSEFAAPRLDFSLSNGFLRVGEFYMETRSPGLLDLNFHFNTPTTLSNTMRVLRGLQLSKPILLEGNPGVGKTSIIAALAKAAGIPLTRINLSEQTDLMDLFGSDVPVEDADVGQFEWRDAPFLSAMKRGDWVLLDEMNLASQSVLEGLNACLDHRGEVYVTELDQRFLRHPDFRLFATQNPHHQGGGRKGLPASFVNRFTVVFADVFPHDDLVLICTQLYPSIDSRIIKKLVSFVTELDLQVGQLQRFGARGSPWEFNLRDALRWLQLLTSNEALLPGARTEDFLALLFCHRFRSSEDVLRVEKMFEYTFAESIKGHNLFTNLSPTTFQIGHSVLPRSRTIQHHPVVQYGLNRIELTGRLALFESLMHCVQQTWPVILVGPTGSGKTHLLDSLASAVGSHLVTFAMNPDVDATDLVGGFEQVDPSRSLQSLIRDLELFALNVLANKFSNFTVAHDDPVAFSAGEILNHLRCVGRKEASLDQVKTALRRIAIQENSTEIDNLLQQCNNLQDAATAAQAAKFEWVDGVLVQALEKGYWLVLDNANLCSSSVLDRLNYLLEPNGYLIVNEHCSEDGTAKVVRPHPSFRIFLTMDPQYGELSRAMRNRSVELFVPAMEELQLESKVMPRRMLPLESSVSRFQQFMVSLSTAQQDTGVDPAAFSHVASSLLSLEDMRSIDRFLKDLKSGLLSESVSQPNNIITTRNVAQFYCNNVLRDTPEAMYKRVNTPLLNSVDFARSQSIHALSNSPLVSFMRKFPAEYDPFWLGAIFELCYMLEKISSAIRSESSTIIRDVSSMTRWQRSLQADKIPNAEKESTAAVAPFLKGVRKEILTWACSSRRGEPLDELVLYAVRGVVHFSGELLDLVSTNPFDEAVFQSFLTSGRHIVDAFPETDVMATQLKQVLRDLLGTLSIRMQLSTGQSMERIWKTFLAIGPPTTKELAELIQLEHMANRFDQLVWKIDVPLAEKNSLRQSIGRAVGLATCQKAPIERLATELQQTLDTVQQVQTLETFSEPTLRPAFECITQLIDLQFIRSDFSIHDVESNNEQNTMISLLACRETRSAFQWQMQPMPATVPAALLKYAESRKMLFTSGAMADVVVNTLVATKEAPIHQMDQLQSELHILGKHFATENAGLCYDINAALEKLLRTFFCSLLDSHQDIISAESIHTISTALTRGWSSSNQDYGLRYTVSMDHYIHPISNQYLQPCLDSLLSRGDARVNSDVLGFAYSKFALGSLLLYVTNQPFDPALNGQVQEMLHTRRMLGVRNELACLTLLENVMTGQGSNIRSEVLRREIDSIGDMPARPPRVARPKDSELWELQNEFTIILRLVKEVARRIDTGHVSVEESEELCGAIYRITERLADGFHSYRDITRTTTSFLCCLTIGLNLLSRSSATVNRSADNFGFLRIIPFIGLKPGIDWPGVQNLTIDATKFMLSAYSLRSQIEAHGPRSFRLVEQISTMFNQLFYQWKNQLSSDKEKAAASSSLYHYRGTQNDDETIENEFRALFPNFDEDEEHSEQTSGNVTSQSGLAALSANLHLDIFVSDKSLSSKALELISHATSSTGVKHIGGAEMQTLVPAILLSIRDRIHEISPVNIAVSNFNIYLDPSPVEAQRIRVLVQETRSRFSSIAEAWPEHDTLHTVLNTCKEIMNFTRSEPLMKILTKTEKLHGQVAEWQSVTSSEYSAASVYNKLTDILISWRQLELSTWARLLDNEIEKTNHDAHMWWFLLYENVIANPTTGLRSEADVEKHTVELLHTLETFLSNSTAGQFSEKLRMLSSLQKHVKALSDERPWLYQLADAVHHFITHFQRFMPIVSAKLAQGRDGLEKELKNVVQLATWKDRNISALKQSAKSSHRKLFRIIRKYRDLLSQPVVPCLGEDVQDDSSNDKISTHKAFEFSSQSDVAVRALEACRLDTASWQSRPLRYKNIEITLQTMQDRLKRSSREISFVSTLEDFLVDLEMSRTELRTATPRTLTNENASLVKHLSVRKRRVLTDALKMVGKMGIKRNFGVDLLAGQESLAKMLAGLGPSMENAQIFPMPQKQDMLHGVLDLMPQIRATLNNHSEDLSQEEVSRCVGYLEGFLLVSLRQRRTLAIALGKFERMGLAIQRMKNLWPDDHGHGVFIKKEAHLNSTLALKELLSWLPTVIRVGLKVLEAQSEMGQLDLNFCTKSLQEWAEYFERLQQDISALPDMPTRLSNRAEQDLEDSIKTGILNFKSLLSTWSEEEPRIKITLDHITTWTVPGQGSTLTDQNGHFYQSMKAFDSKLFECLDGILGSVQDVQGAKELFPESLEVMNWFAQEDNAQRQTLTAFHIASNANRIEHLIGEMHLVEDNDSSQIHRASASVTAALPIFRLYHDALRVCLEEFQNLHLITCKVSYHLAKSFRELSNQGFCKPAEKSDEKGKSDELESGTGLGEGEGAEDISKDIGDDEDLSELAQDTENKRREDGIENEDDAVEISEELEGAAGDEFEKEDADREAGSEDEGKTESDNMENTADGGQETEGPESGDSIDEGVGDVDDLGPSAVDEKLWDQTGDESKEKESKQKTGEVDKTEDVAAEGPDSKGENTDRADESADEQESDIEDSKENIELSETASMGDEEQLDPHLKESEVLDLPEELQLDGDKASPTDDMDQDADEGMEDELQRQGEERMTEDNTGGDEEDTGLDEAQEDASDMTQEDAEMEETENRNIPDDQHASEQDDEMEELGTGYGDDRRKGGIDQTTQERSAPENNLEADLDEHDPSAEQSSFENSAQAQTGTESRPTNEAQSNGDQSGRESNEEQRQAFKKLGDILEKWHRQHRPIREIISGQDTGQEKQENVDMTDMEFEHLPEEDATADTQALGAATQDEARALNEQMVLPSGNDNSGREQDQFLPDVQEESFEDNEEDAEMRDSSANQAETQQMQSQDQHGGTGDNRDDQESSQNESLEADDDDRDMNLANDLEESLATMELDLESASPTPMTMEEAISVWQDYESRIHPLSLVLTEQLRLILAPTLATKLRGDFRTGKRLNIKRIIPYIASQYKRDKIWMRRSVPSKRAYQVLLAIDDSSSMADEHNVSPTEQRESSPSAMTIASSKSLAFETMALVARSLSTLEVGEVGVLGFGQDVHVAHPLGTPFTSEAGAAVLQQFNFTQQRTDILKLVEESIRLLREARARQQQRSSGDLWQLEFIISDGICEDHEGIRRLLVQAREERIMMVFVIVDAGASGRKAGQSIVDLESVEFIQTSSGDPEGSMGSGTSMKMERKRYLDTFPFGYYILVKDVKELPGILATALRQWFAEVSELS